MHTFQQQPKLRLMSSCTFHAWHSPSDRTTRRSPVVGIFLLRGGRDAEWKTSCFPVLFWTQ